MRMSSKVPALAVVVLCTAHSVSAQPALRAAASTRAMSEVALTIPARLGSAEADPKIIRVEYGQPHLRGRALLTDSLVPYDKPWRIGANAATRLITDVDLVLGGATLAKGTYILFALPSRAGWRLIVQKNQSTPEVIYEVENDIVRVDLRARTLAEPVESLSIALIPSLGTGSPHGELRIAWGTVCVSTDWSVK